MKFQCPNCNRIAHAREDEYEDMICNVCSIVMDPIDEDVKNNKKYRFDDEYF